MQPVSILDFLDQRARFIGLQCTLWTPLHSPRCQDEARNFFSPNKLNLFNYLFDPSEHRQREAKVTVLSLLTSAPPRPRPCIKQRRRCRLPPGRPPAAGPIIKQPRRPLRILAYNVRGPRSRLPVVRGRGGAIPRARARAPPPPQTEDSSYALTHMLSAHCFSVIHDSRPSRGSSMRGDGCFSPVNVHLY